MKKLNILLIFTLLTSCTNNLNNTNYIKEKTFLGYTTDCDNNMVLLLNTEVYLTTVNNNLKNDLIDVATSEITKYHKLLDSHHKYYDQNNKLITNINILNDYIGKGPIIVDPIIIDSINEAINLTKLTKGYFNFTLGELSNLYHDKLLPYDTTNTDPNNEEIKKLVKGIIPYNKIEEYIIIDENNNTIELKKNSYPYSLDLGAFSKGYIIDKVYKELIKYNTSFLLNAGSSSIVTYSNTDENISWTISVKNPIKSDEQLLSFSCNNGAISTSGDYENYYYLENGTKRHHILNPYTGYSENYYNSNTLISNNACIIDALSTALFNINDQQEYNEIINNIEIFYKEDISYLAIQNGLNIYMDKSFSDSVTSTIPISNNLSVTTTIIEK